MSHLLQAYHSRENALMAFYEQAPESLYDTPGPTPSWSPELLQALRDYQQRLGLERTIQGNEWVIVTGQQPGLFTGPLYTIYKAITAIQLAAACEARTGQPHLPVYWVASDDHDFEEVRSSHFLTRNHTLHRHRYQPSDIAPASLGALPMFQMPVAASLHEDVEALGRLLRNGPSGQVIQELLHDTLSAADSLADWHARLMAALFRDTPLCIFAPHLDAARKVVQPVMAHEIRHPLESTRLLNTTGEELAALGFDPQVVKAPDECNFFLFVEGQRRKVCYRQGTYQVAGEQQRHSPEALEALLEKSPEAFSPNVALRCVAQQALFPTRSYVAGPGELAYWAQLRPFFRHFAYSMPVVYPRAQALLLPEKAGRLRANYALEHADFTQPFPQLLEAALSTLPPLESQDIFHRHNDALRGQVGSMLEAIRRTSPHQAHAQRHAERFTTAFEHHLRKLERGLLQGDIERNQQVQAHLSRLVNTLAPNQKPQERVLNIFSFLFEHGLALIPRLLQDLSHDADHTQEIWL